MKNVGILLNPGIKNISRFHQDLEIARGQHDDVNFVVREIDKAGGGIDKAEGLAKDQMDVIVAIGGDGTINEMVNGVLSTGGFEGKLATLPYGTANDFCKTVPSPDSLTTLIDSIENNAVKKLDVGHIDYIDASHQTQQRYFINIADLGLGAEVVQRVNRSRKRLGADVTFMKAIVQTFFTYKNQAVRIAADNWAWEGKANSVVVANCKFFGSGLCIAPGADPSDGEFEIVISGNISLRDYLTHVNKLKNGHPVKHPEVFYKKAKNIKIEGIDKPCGIECDGEFLGYTPVSINLVHKGLTFITKKGH